MRSGPDSVAQAPRVNGLRGTGPFGSQGHGSGFPGRGLFHRSLGRRIMKRDLFGWLGVVLLLLGGLTLSAPFALQAIDSAGQTASAESAALPTPDGRRMIEEAKAYNEGLAGRPQSVLGEAGDAFSGASYSGEDKGYRGLLDADGEGTMGAVRYPRLHIKPAGASRHGRRHAGEVGGAPLRDVAAGGRGIHARGRRGTPGSGGQADVHESWVRQERRLVRDRRAGGSGCITR